jgi:putative mRNA 3-end processing factor
VRFGWYPAIIKEDDGISTPFEPVKCHHFISECTFGMPVYSWKPQVQIFDDVNNWWRTNLNNGVATVIVGYSLGKAQRILQNLDLSMVRFIPTALLKTLTKPCAATE